MKTKEMLILTTVVRFVQAGVVAAFVMFSAWGGDGLDGTGWTSFPVNGGGYLMNVVIAPSDPNVWYSYVDISGPYRSDDAGRSWRPLHQNLTTEQRHVFAEFVRSVSIDPRTPDTFVMASGMHRSAPAGIYVTTDGGKSFKRTLIARFGGEDVLRGCGLGDALVRDPTDANVLLAAAEGDGVFRSEDRGLTWRKWSDFGRVRPTDIRFDRNDPKVRYFGPGEHEAGAIVPRSGDRVVIDRGARVFGNIVLVGVTNVVVEGRGVIDTSRIRRVDHGYSGSKVVAALKVPPTATSGRPAASWTMQISSQRQSAPKPQPSALAKASLAAKTPA